MTPYDPDLALRIYRYRFDRADAARPAARVERRRAGKGFLRGLKSRLVGSLTLSAARQIRRRPA